MEAWSLSKEGLGPRWELAPVDSVRLANNNLDTLIGIPTAIGRFLFMGSPAVLISLDLSFNNIRRLEGRVSRHLWLISTNASSLDAWQRLNVGAFGGRCWQRCRTW